MRVYGYIERLSKALYSLARPYLTVLIATMFNAICAWAWWRGDLTAIEYITALGPTNSMIIGFWFGERAALKVPDGACEGKKSQDAESNIG